MTERDSFFFLVVSFNRKAHRNGLHKPATNKYPSLKGVDPKFMRNARHAAQGTQKALAAARAAAIVA